VHALLLLQRAKLETLAVALLEHETIESAQLQTLLGHASVPAAIPLTT
jgi:ATP-dependent Zn protease